MSYIVKSKKIRTLAKSKFGVGMSKSADPVIASAIEDIIEKAANRAKANGRKVIKARDV